MKYVVHENSSHVLTAEELRDMLSFHTGQQEYSTWLRAFCDRKLNSGFAREMTRSVRKYLADFT